MQPQSLLIVSKTFDKGECITRFSNLSSLQQNLIEYPSHTFISKA